MGIVGKYCFPGNTKISTPHGNIPIEKLINNKKLLSWDENLNNINIANQKNFLIMENINVLKFILKMVEN